MHVEAIDEQMSPLQQQAIQQRQAAQQQPALLVGVDRASISSPKHEVCAEWISTVGLDVGPPPSTPVQDHGAGTAHAAPVVAPASMLRAWTVAGGLWAAYLGTIGCLEAS